jgi:cellulose synthase/poly-beta-1,6-N-acetylglucosamine synthase-like glycosyltransferase
VIERHGSRWQTPQHSRVTVVIPVGQAGECVTQQVSAVLAQEAPFPFDVVLSCNTTDSHDCAAIDDIPRTIGDPRVHVVPAHEHRSPAYARNVGARSSDADVLAFCDADDLVEPGWLAALVSHVSDGVAVGGYLDEQTFAVRGQEQWRPPITPGALPTFLGVPYAVSANMALDRAAFERAGGFDDGLVRCEDIALSWRLKTSGIDIDYAPEAVVHYRHRTGVRALVKQHFLYGRGMAQVLCRYGVPHDGGVEHVDGLGALRPNGQAMEHRTFVGTFVRRASIAAGRVVGLAAERGRVAAARIRR